MKALRSIIGSMSYNLDKTNRYWLYNTVEGLAKQAFSQNPTNNNTVFVFYKKDWDAKCQDMIVNSFDLIEAEIVLSEFNHLKHLLNV